MAKVANGATYQVAQELMELVGDLHKRGELTETAFLELATAVGWGTFQAGLDYLRESGIVPTLTVIQPPFTRRASS